MGYERLKKGIRYLLYFIIIFAIAGALPIAYLFNNQTSFNFLQWVDIIGTADSLVLSLILVILYDQLRSIQSGQKNIQEDQKEIEETQTEIQDQQRHLLELSQLPRLIIDSWRIDEDELELSIANVGEGTATNIGYRLSVTPYDPANLHELFTDDAEIEDHEVVPFVRCDESAGKHRNALAPTEDGRFKETARIPIARGPQTNSSTRLEPFSEKINEIVNQSEVARLNINFELVYLDPIHDEYQRVPIMGVSLERDDCLDATFEKVITGNHVAARNPRQTILPENIDESRAEYLRRTGRIIASRSDSESEGQEKIEEK